MTSNNRPIKCLMTNESLISNENKKVAWPSLENAKCRHKNVFPCQGPILQNVSPKIWAPKLRAETFSGCSGCEKVWIVFQAACRLPQQGPPEFWLPKSANSGRRLRQPYGWVLSWSKSKCGYLVAWLACFRGTK